MGRGRDFDFDGRLRPSRPAPPGSPPPPEERAWARRVGQGLDTTRHDGALHGSPALVVHGRADTRAPVDHDSRPHLGLNSPADTAEAHCPAWPSQGRTDRAARGEPGHAPAPVRADVPPVPTSPAPGEPHARAVRCGSVPD
ncbi:3-hydroxybutyrate oligomer hydrolase family protein [Streptomyces swartbergensis]|uniref:3-hydroxybutyrate oligomer hydrolase family protein n=1 Tax=Streptomyces swartbergensis TaxID=487165 RepID=UPI0038027FA0